MQSQSLLGKSCRGAMKSIRKSSRVPVKLSAPVSRKPCLSVQAISSPPTDPKASDYLATPYTQGRISNSRDDDGKSWAGFAVDSVVRGIRGTLAFETPLPIALRPHWLVLADILELKTLRNYLTPRYASRAGLALHALLCLAAHGPLLLIAPTCCSSQVQGQPLRVRQ